MRKLELKQDTGTKLYEKQSYRGFWAKTKDLYIKTEKIQGLTREKARGGRRVQILESAGA